MGRTLHLIFDAMLFASTDRHPAISICRCWEGVFGRVKLIANSRINKENALINSGGPWLAFSTDTFDVRQKSHQQYSTAR